MGLVPCSSSSTAANLRTSVFLGFRKVFPKVFLRFFLRVFYGLLLRTSGAVFFGQFLNTVVKP